jgi:hypothetical protein
VGVGVDHGGGLGLDEFLEPPGGVVGHAGTEPSCACPSVRNLGLPLDRHTMARLVAIALQVRSPIRELHHSKGHDRAAREQDRELAHIPPRGGGGSLRWCGPGFGVTGAARLPPGCDLCLQGGRGSRSRHLRPHRGSRPPR